MTQTTETTPAEGTAARDTPVPKEIVRDSPIVQLAVEHRSRLATGVALAAAAFAVAWFARALQTGEVLAWAWCLILGAVAVVQLLVVRDSSAPLLLADDQGVRVRAGETWSGLRWPDIDRVEVRSARRRGSGVRRMLADGHLTVHPRASEEDVAALSVPLAATTRLRFEGLTGDLVADLDALASGRTPVVVLTASDAPADAAGAAPVDVTDRPDRGEPEPAREPQVVEAEVEVVVLGAPENDKGVVLPRQVTAEERDEAEGAHPREHSHPRPAPDARVPTLSHPPVAPVRATLPAARSESIRARPRSVTAPLEVARPAGGEHVVVAPIDEFAERRPRPVTEPVIGPIVAAARQRARLSIDALSERTRIRPHVLECLEVDDFEPCGGDFYARGHLRTLARIFGLDAEELLSSYDAHYARPAIEARQVFEAELATGIGGGMRATWDGPRWSVLAAAVVALGLVWGAAQLFTEQPQQIVSPAPAADSAGLAGAEPSRGPQSTLAALAVTATGASPQVVVRDRDGRILWAGKLADGQRQRVIGLAPFDVTASNGQAVEVTFLGKSRGTVGRSGAADSRQFG